MSFKLPATLNVPARSALSQRLGRIALTLREGARQSAADPANAPLDAVPALLETLPAGERSRIATRARARSATPGVPVLAKASISSATLGQLVDLPARPVRALPKPAAPDAANAGVTWSGRKYVGLYLDSIVCVRTTAEIGKDEIAIFGTIFDVGAAESKTIGRLYLGKFSQGTTVSYAADGGRLLSYANLSNASALPTYAAAILGLVEEDSKGWASFITTMYNLVRPLLEAALDEALELDEGLGDLSAAEVEAILQDLGMLILDEVVAELDAASNDDFFRNVARTASPAINVPASDSWGGDWKSDRQTLYYEQGNAQYKVRVFWKRLETV